MQQPRFTAHAVHLFERGRYVRTLPDSFSPAQAAQFVLLYNRIGQRQGRVAVTTADEVAVRVPTLRSESA